MWRSTPASTSRSPRRTRASDDVTTAARIAVALPAAVLLLLAAPARAEVDDGGPGAEPSRIEWLFIKPGLGYHRVWLRTLHADDSDRLTARVIPEQLSGPAPSLGVGVKLWFVTLGVTGRVAHLS